MTFYNLNLYSDLNPFDLYEQISLRKKSDYKRILYGPDSSKSSTYHIVKEQYENYENYKENLEIVTSYKTFTDQEKEALRHNYNGNTMLVKDLKTNIINIQNIHYRNKCVYCGIGDIKCMDHYLPKEEYPEFAVHNYNLIPCCSYCNEKKSSHFIDEEGFRKVFNPYFDKNDNEIVLFCKITCYETSLKSNILPSEEINNKVYSNHLHTINLISRYEDELPRKLSSLIHELISIYEESEITQSQVKSVLQRKLNRINDIQGPNSLEALIYRAFLSNENLLDLRYLKEVYLQMYGDFF